MAYTPATVIPTNQKYFTWYIPGGGVPRLTAPFSSTDTEIHWSVIPTDHTGARITGGFHMNIQGANGVSIIYVPTSAVDSDGLGATGVVHGWYEGLDYTTADTVNDPIDHSTDDVVSCCISPTLQFIDHSVLIGNVGLSATGIPYYASAPTFTPGSNQLCSILYADNLAIAGSPNMSLTTKGIGEEATTSEINAGTQTGGTGAELVVNPFYLSSSIYNTQLPTSGQKSALVGDNTDIAVGSGNTYVTQTGLQHNAEKYAADSGSSSAYVVTLSPAPTSYTNGMVVYMKAANANTVIAPTVNVNSLGAKTIVNPDGSALKKGQIPASGLVELQYDGTNMQLLSSWNSSYAPNTNIADNYTTIQAPIVSATGSLTSIPGWVTTTTTTAAGDGAAGYAVLSGSGGGAFTMTASLPGSGSTANYSPAQLKQIRIKTKLKFDGTSDRAGWGLCVTAADIHTAQTDTTNGEVRFIRNGASLYAQNANGTATSTDVTSGITLTNWNTYEIVFNPGTNILYYINNTLVATSTTNLPTTGTLLLAYGVNANGRSITTTFPIVTIEN